MYLISIVIPSFNRGHIIADTIESVISQTYQNWELIIVDDGSIDDTENVVRQFTKSDNRIRFINRSSGLTKGANTCRNIGFVESTGEFIKWVDSDDLLDKYILETQIKEFHNNPELDLVVCNGVFFTDDGILNTKYWSRDIVSINLLYDYIRNNVRWHVCGCLWRKSFFESPPYKEGLQNAQEWLMHSQSILRKPVIRGLDDALFYVRMSSEGRISTNRNTRYFINAAKARLYLLLQDYTFTKLTLKESFELIKQIIINMFHAVKSTLLKQLPQQ